MRNSKIVFAALFLTAFFVSSGYCAETSPAQTKTAAEPVKNPEPAKAAPQKIPRTYPLMGRSILFNMGMIKIIFAISSLE